MSQITTTKGLMDESELRRVDGGIDDDNEDTTWVEYYLGDELVHRSVHVRLKQGHEFNIALGAFN
jgi:hypothetical protein